TPLMGSARHNLTTPTARCDSLLDWRPQRRPLNNLDTRAPRISDVRVLIPPTDYTTRMFPLDRWYVAGVSCEFQAKPMPRPLLNQPVVLFRSGGKMAALEDRCCHRHLPLSCGVIEGSAIRCGYHGLLYAQDGRCIEIPGQLQIPRMACVRAYPLQERNHI